MLPPNDVEYLQARAPEHTVTVEAGHTCVVIPGFSLGGGYVAAQSDLLLRLAPGYPDVPPDMWWFSPAVQRIDRVQIAATQVTEAHLGRMWQRWSRHLGLSQWRSGIDCLETYLAIVRRELSAAAPKAAA